VLAGRPAPVSPPESQAPAPRPRVDQPERRPGVRVGSRPVPASQRVRLADPGSGIVMPAGIRHRWRRLPVAVHLLLNARRALMMRELLIVARCVACQLEAASAVSLASRSACAAVTAPSPPCRAGSIRSGVLIAGSPTPRRYAARLGPGPGAPTRPPSSLTGQPARSRLARPGPDGSAPGS